MTFKISILVTTGLSLIAASSAPIEAQQIQLETGAQKTTRVGGAGVSRATLCKDAQGNTRTEGIGVEANWPPNYGRDYEMRLFACPGSKPCFLNKNGNDPQAWQSDNSQHQWVQLSTVCKGGGDSLCKWSIPHRETSQTAIFFKAHIFRIRDGRRITTPRDSQLLIVKWDWPIGRDGKRDTEHKCAVQPPTDFSDAKLAWDGDGHVDVNPGHLHVNNDENMSWTFNGRATNGAIVSCSGHLTAPYSSGAVAGWMKCDLTQGQTRWSCEGAAVENPGWQEARSGGAFYATGLHDGPIQCKGTVTKPGKTVNWNFGLLWVSKG